MRTGDSDFNSRISLADARDDYGERTIGDGVAAIMRGMEAGTRQA
jgi:hypothetical protein